MEEEERSADDFLASQGTLSIESVDQLEGFLEPDSDNSRLKASGSAEWVELQHARTEYLKEWEEDMRFAQELAEAGMHG